MDTAPDDAMDSSVRGGEVTSGTLAFLFTDLEGSTRLWERHPEAMKAAIARHDDLLRDAIESSRGHVVKTMGDGLMAVLPTAGDAVRASVEAQRALASEPWGDLGALRVRMGLHAGVAHETDGDYFGRVVNRTARIMGVAYGGQVLVSGAAAELLRDDLPGGVSLRDLGEHRLKDLERAEHLCQVVHPDLPADFPPLVSLSERPNNLPTQVSAFIGRERELAEVRSRIESPETRLVTLFGPGGTGKTRLALQAAAEEVERFADGVFFVDLADAVDVESVLVSIIRSVGLEETTDEIWHRHLAVNTTSVFYCVRSPFSARRPGAATV
jgi:class 3 adenylate cyclase